MRVTFLGTGTSSGVPVPTCDCEVCRSDDPRDRRLRPSVRLEWDGASVLIDTATDLRQQALRYGIDRVDAVLYTHAHADHILGLDELRLYNWRQRGPVPIIGSPGTLNAIARTFWYVFEDGPAGTARPTIELLPVEAPFNLLRRSIVPIPVLHGTLPIFGYRIGRFAYLTDVSQIPETSYPLLEGLSVVVLNALRERPHPTHLTLDQALEQASRIAADRTLFTHFSHEISHAATSASLPPGVELAYDGLQISIDEEEEPPE